MPHLRSHHRRGAGGKSIATLDLIEHYWDQIEGDFAYLLHIDARDWVRGLRPWDQFYTYCQTIAQIPGSRLRAAQLSDDRYLAEVELMMERNEMDATQTRPPMENFTPEVEALYMVANDIRLLIRAMTQGAQVEFHPMPMTPLDRIAERKRLIGRAKIAEITGEGG